jgi:hypothetical protein
MAGNPSLLNWLLMLIAAACGSMAGAVLIYFLLRLTLFRNLESSVRHMNNQINALRDDVAVMRRSLQKQAADAPGQTKTVLPREPAGAAIQAARTGPDDPKHWRDLLPLYAADPGAFQDRAGAKPVSVRKLGSGTAAATGVYEHPNGRFWLFTTEEGAWVIPKPGLRIDDTSYYDTGIRDLFECPRYESHRAYAFHVVRPAQVNQSGDTWILAHNGLLELQAEAGA